MYRKSRAKFRRPVIGIFGTNFKKLNPYFGLLVPELAALTLQSNKSLVAILSYFENLEPNKTEWLYLPAPTSDRWSQEKWINDKVVNKNCTTKFKASDDERSDLLLSLLNNNDQRYDSFRQAIKKQSQINHIAVRAYPIALKTPECNKDKHGKRLLIVAYHLTRHCLYFFISKLEPKWSETELKDIKISEDLISDLKWKEFKGKIETLLTDGKSAQRENQVFFIHVPEASPLEKASPLETVLRRYFPFVIADMAKRYTGEKCFEVSVYGRNSSKINNKCFPIPGINNEIEESYIKSMLGKLLKMKHAEKNKFITELSEAYFDLQEEMALLKTAITKAGIDLNRDDASQKSE